MKYILNCTRKRLTIVRISCNFTKLQVVILQNKVVILLKKFLENLDIKMFQISLEKSHHNTGKSDYIQNKMYVMIKFC